MVADSSSQEISKLPVSSHELNQGKPKPLSAFSPGTQDMTLPSPGFSAGSFFADHQGFAPLKSEEDKFQMRMLPREHKLLEKSTQIPEPKTAKIENKIKPKGPRKIIRKKKKFHLLPTFKHLENGRFIGRNKELKHLRQLLVDALPINHSTLRDTIERSSRQQVLAEYNKLNIVSITGSAGIGKSSLAYIYLLSYENRYKYVFWINANNILSDIRDILLYHVTSPLEVQALKLETKAEILKIRFLHFLTRLESNWLVVFDDYGDSHINIQEWIPKKLENLDVNKLHKFMLGHVIITTSLTATAVRRKFSNFKTKIRCLKLSELCDEEARKLLIVYSDRSASDKNFSATYHHEISRFLDSSHLCCNPLPTVLLGNLARHTSASIAVLLRRFEEQEAFLQATRNKRLETVYKKYQQEKSREEEIKRQKGSRAQKLVRKTLKRTLPKENRATNNSFNPRLFEVELFLRQHGVYRYFPFLKQEKIESITDLVLNQAVWWPRVKPKVLPKDFERFENLILMAENTLSQNRVTVIIKLWIDDLTRKVENMTGNVGLVMEQTISTLRQCSWLSEKRIPLFLFPELMLESQECFEIVFNPFVPIVAASDETSVDTGSHSGSSFSTVTHNTYALSQMDLKLLGSVRMAKGEAPPAEALLHLKFDNDLLSRPSILAFLLRNNLVKMEKIGYFSLNRQVQTALKSLEAASPSGIASINVILEKFHHLSFELNFETLFGESLEYLLSNPGQIENDSKLFDLTQNIRYLHSQASKENKLKSYINKRYSLKLNLLPHFNDLRINVAGELERNTSFQNRLKKSWSDEEGILKFKKISEKIEEKLSSLNLAPEVQGVKRFNATISSLFPNFHERAIELILCDLTFNEGVILLDIPFRKSRYQDALKCFEVGSSGCSFFLSEQNEVSDPILPRSLFFSGMCHFRLNHLAQSLTLFKASLKQYHRFHGKYTNHVDIARVFSCIACVNHELLKNSIAKANLDGASPGNERWSSVHETKMKAYKLEALKYHNLSLKIYEDLYVSQLTRNYCRALLNKGRTLLLYDIKSGRETLKKVLSIYLKMDEVCGLPLNSSKIGKVCMTICDSYTTSLTQNNKKELLKFFDLGLASYSSLFRYEQAQLLGQEYDKSLLSAKSTPLQKSIREFLDMKLVDIPAHNLIIDAFVDIGKSLLKNYVPLARVFLATAVVKLEELYGNFKHPQLFEVKQYLLNTARQ
eukprot:augustus_masked-scaffold_7-processed-gene-5.11-mRNA-1 protein AED:1.00 eAED:1.00 QI:0/-1/0/0/-1/1/1/0/1213